MNDAEEHFIYVRLPLAIGPLERGDIFEDPLDEVLHSAGIGAVTGGGTALSEAGPDGTRHIEYCGLDVDVSNLDAALAVLRAELPKLGAPDGTQIEYSRDGNQFKDVLTGGKWRQSDA